MSQKNGAEYVIFWQKLLLKAIQKQEIGILRYKENKPYTPELLSTITDINIDIVKGALALFQKMGMIEINEKGDIWIEKANELVGSESDSARRVRKFREKSTNKQIEDKRYNVTKCNVETELETELEKELEKELVSSRSSASQNDPIINSFLKNLSNSQRVKLIEAQSDSNNTIENMLKYVEFLTKEKNKQIDNIPGYVYRGLEEDWNLSGEDYYEWGRKQVGYD